MVIESLDDEPLSNTTSSYISLQDGARSAFLPYKPSVTVLTNLQRGNTKAKSQGNCNKVLSFFQLAAKGDLSVEQISKETNLNVFDEPEGGLTPLMWASAYGQSHTVEDLLEAGASVGLANSRGNTALHFASNSGYPDVVKILIAWGADVNFCDQRGNSALILACSGNHPLTVSLLVANGADISTVNVLRSTAYKTAIQRHFYEVQQILENHMKQLLTGEQGHNA